MSKTSRYGKKKILPPVTKNISLRKYGYDYITSESTRREALRKASSKHGILDVLKHLVLIANYQHPVHVQNIMRKDIDYLKRKYKAHKKQSGGCGTYVEHTRVVNGKTTQFRTMNASDIGTITDDLTRAISSRNAFILLTNDRVVAYCWVERTDTTARVHYYASTEEDKTLLVDHVRTYLTGGDLVDMFELLNV
jgi:hypothetical protein